MAFMKEEEWKSVTCRDCLHICQQLAQIPKIKGRWKVDGANAGEVINVGDNLRLAKTHIPSSYAIRAEGQPQGKTKIGLLCQVLEHMK